MKLKLVAGLAALTALVAGCVPEMSPEKRTQVQSAYQPKVNAFIPACIAAAQGRTPDYGPILALGYTQRKSMIGDGDYLYAPNSGLMNSVGIKFVPRDGCYESPEGVAGTYLGGMQELGEVWIASLKAAGYQETGDSPSLYQFSANGVPMIFSGSFQDGSISFRLYRDR